MRRIVIAGCVLLLLAGCASIQNRNKDRLRDQTLEGYAAALRWGGFQSALSYVDPAVRAAHPLTPQQKALYNTVSVAEYETSGPVAASDNDVEQTVQISLIVHASQSIRNVIDHQTWHWDDKAKRWWLETGLPDIAPGN
ncbi:MAG TPA: hypothetical protein VFL63_03500 [Rhodanobacteraceae bacterium]|jgi:hypothetical protein|nr:hypothetical protein [Rhodanobacteraceae bacterium]